MSTSGEPPRGEEPEGKGEPPKRVRLRGRRVGRRENIPPPVTARAVERYRFLLPARALRPARAVRRGARNRICLGGNHP